jgi:hypothetical protein
LVSVVSVTFFLPSGVSTTLDEDDLLVEVSRSQPTSSDESPTTEIAAKRAIARDGFDAFMVGVLGFRR